MMDSGEPCPKCKQNQMPRWSPHAMARACQNPKCQFVEARDKCRVLNCNNKREIQVEFFTGMTLNVCYAHSRLDTKMVKKMIDKGLI